MSNAWKQVIRLLSCSNLARNFSTMKYDHSVCMIHSQALFDLIYVARHAYKKRGMNISNPTKVNNDRDRPVGKMI